jgi:hypothetical protein
MKWAAVEIKHADAETAKRTADALKRILVTVTQDRKAPADFELWHLQTGFAHHVYYLSPRLAFAADGRLGAFAVQSLAAEPDLADARRVLL